MHTFHNTNGVNGQVKANRNKKSVGISFKHSEGQAIIRELVKKSDVLVENYLPGTLEKYGLSYKQLAEINPRLIYASITGYASSSMPQTLNY